MIKIDIFVATGSTYSQSEFRRIRREKLGEGPDRRQANFTSPEDIVLRKLEWYRTGGELSERQWSDVLGVLKVQSTALDLTYLRQWAPALGVTDLVERALGEAGIGYTKAKMGPPLLIGADTAGFAVALS